MGQAPRTRETTPRDEHTASSAPVELALPGHRVRPLEGEAPQALRGWARFTASSAPVELALPGHRVRPLEGEAPQALRGWFKLGVAPQALQGWFKSAPATKP